jgi:multidrug efflux pump subunit AcrA (membrane-fusion protein)
MNREYSLSYRLTTLSFSWRLQSARPAASTRRSSTFERPPAPVTVAPAVAQDVANYLDALGKIVARETVAIQPQVSGRITQIHFTDGANVKKGQRLFTDRSASTLKRTCNKRRRTSRATAR